MFLRYLLSQAKPSPWKGEVQVHVKLAFNTLSLAHTALVSHGPESQGSGTAVLKFEKQVIVVQRYLLSQVKPSPWKGEVQVQVNASVNTLSLAHTALVSHGSESQGLGAAVLKI